MRVVGMMWLASVLGATLFAAEDRPPNILFILTDDHAEAAISAYGSNRNQTPNIDRLAAEGALFRNSFCSNSICAPARANLLTGRHSHRNGVRSNGDTFDASQPTFVRALKDSGYQTALIGKWHLRSTPTDFDHWEVLPGQGNYYNPDFLSADGKRRVEGYATDVITDLSLEWLTESRDPDRPFLLLCWHKAPHRTWAPPARHLELYADGPLPEPATLFDDYAGRHPSLVDNEMSIADYFYWDYDLKVPDSGLPNPFDRALKSPETRRMTDAQRAIWDAAYGPRNAAFLRDVPTGDDLVRWKYQRYIKDYLRTVQAVDDNVGRLLDHLDETCEADDTLVIYSSDQGFYLGEHGWYDKRWMFEESLRTPLLMRWPGRIEKASEVDALVQNIDVAPTILDAAEIEAPDEFQGESLLPLMDGEADPEWREGIYYAYYEEGEHNVPRHDGIRTARHKLMHFPGTRTWQLFDLVADPSELQSLHEDPEHATLLRSMRLRYELLRRDVGATPWSAPSVILEHEVRDVEGFQVHADVLLVADEVGELTLNALRAELFELSMVVEPSRLAKLREVPIYVDLDHPLGGLQYHPSARWLREHGHDPAMAKAVHAPTAKRFVDLVRSNVQPWVIMHELAHAYHDRVLGFDEPRIIAAYERVKAAGLYEQVLHVNGRDTKHYALTNPKEFFAEMTEAYLGTNDFFPFVRAELKQVDRETHALMAEIWGK